LLLFCYAIVELANIHTGHASTHQTSSLYPDDVFLRIILLLCCVIYAARVILARALAVQTSTHVVLISCAVSATCDHQQPFVVVEDLVEDLLERQQIKKS
jgi:Na+/proline symporter